jgi:serine/threonine protein phosphatase PrpC
VIIASDGVWEKIPNKIAAKIAEKHYYSGSNSHNAVNEIVNRAMMKWKVVSPFVNFSLEKSLYGRY